MFVSSLFFFPFSVIAGNKNDNFRDEPQPNPDQPNTEISGQSELTDASSLDESMDTTNSDTESLLDTQLDESITLQALPDTPHVQQQHSTSSSSSCDKSLSANGCSASKRKLDSYNIDYDFMEETASDNGYVLVSKSSIKTLLASFSCPQCGQKMLRIRENITDLDGCNMNFEIICLSDACEADIIQKWRTSETVSDRRYADINLRMILAMRNVGAGFSGIQEFCRVMGMPCMHRSTFDRHKERLEASAQKAADRIQRKAGEIVRQEYMKKDPSLKEHDVIDISVSYDATWQKARGFNSKHGVGTVIDLETGVVLDTETMSKYCHSCALVDGKYPDKESQEYNDWFSKHEPNCDINHVGSSGAMEKMAAEAIWRRSVEKHGLQYTTVLSDGDTKTVDHLNTECPYGQEVKINKEECINHISKRMYSNLKNFATKRSAQGKPIGGQGKGKITEKRMKQWGTYYRNAISENVGNVDIMQKRIVAIVQHSASTAQNPRHENCPPGKNSWCYHQKATAEGKKPEVPQNHDPIPDEVARELEKTVFAHLMSRDKLERCQRNGTQNQNECFNKQIWRIQPKQVFGGHSSILFAVNLATLAFNMGATGIQHVMHAARMKVPIKCVQQSMIRDHLRVEKAEAGLNESSKRNRKAKKMALAKEKDNTDYNAGMF